MSNLESKQKNAHSICVIAKYALALFTYFFGIVNRLIIFKQGALKTNTFIMEESFASHFMVL